jgi:hypothetical protein
MFSMQRARSWWGYQQAAKLRGATAHGGDRRVVPGRRRSATPPAARMAGPIAGEGASEGVPPWAEPEGSPARQRERRLEMELGRVCVWRHGITLPGERRRSSHRSWAASRKTRRARKPGPTERTGWRLSRPGAYASCLGCLPLEIPNAAVIPSPTRRNAPSPSPTPPNEAVRPPRKASNRSSSIAVRA